MIGNHRSGNHILVHTGSTEMFTNFINNQQVDTVKGNTGKKRKILIPAKTDLVKPPMGFGINHAADLTDWEAQKSHFGLNGLVRAIASILGPSLLGNWLMQDFLKKDQ